MNIVIQPFSIPEEQIKRNQIEVSNNRKIGQNYPGKENISDQRKDFNRSQTNLEQKSLSYLQKPRVAH